MKCIKAQLGILILVLCPFFMNAQSAKIEYIAHASFVIESDNGTRVLIDPYHSYNQMGYTFPENVEADFVVITHPHFDHDASKYFSGNTPIFREAGTYRFKDIAFEGIPSLHAGAERMKTSGNQSYNTIWVITIGTTKIAHLGDNGIPTKEEIELLKDVDYIIGQPNDGYYNLFEGITYIPNHYLLPEISKHTNWMKPVDPWLEGKENVTRLKNNTFILPKTKNDIGILVFKPSKMVKEWSQNYYDTLEIINQGFGAYRDSKKAEDGLVAMEKAINMSPHVIDGYLYKSILLFPNKEYDTIIQTLEKAFTNVSNIDWGTEARMHGMLADAYNATGRKKQAYHHYLWIIRHDRIANKKTVKEANEFMETYGSK